MEWKFVSFLLLSGIILSSNNSIHAQESCASFLSCSHTNGVFQCQVANPVNIPGIDLPSIPITIPQELFCLCDPSYSDLEFDCAGAIQCNNTCHPNATCLGNNICFCDIGFVGNGTTCTEINQMTPDISCGSFFDCSRSFGNIFCELSQTAVNVGGIFDISQVLSTGLTIPISEDVYCLCNFGVVDSVADCTGSNLPSLETTCNSFANCTVSNGSFFCGLREEFSLTSGINVPIQMISVPVDVFCLCNPSFNDSGVNCNNIDRCSNSTLNNCHPNATCINFPGSAFCYCNEGFLGDGRTCVDINLFTTNPTCSSFVNCGRVNGSLSCGISQELGSISGLVASDLMFPTPDELVCFCDPTYSDSQLTCSNPFLPNSISSACNSLFNCVSANGFFFCGFRPELNVISSVTIPTQMVPVPVEVFCICNPEFVNAEVNCSSFDQCSNSTLNNCNPNATCINTPGSIRCICNPGYIGDGRTCVEIFEFINNASCSSFINCNRNNGTSTCGVSSTIFDLVGIDNNIGQLAGVGSLTDLNFPVPDEIFCLCNPTYGDSSFNCSMFDQCSNSTLNDCHPNAICLTIVENIVCICNDGFIGDGKTCIDLNLLTNNPTCNSFVNCSRTNGALFCGLTPGPDDVGGLIPLNLTFPTPDELVCLCDPSYSDSQLTCSNSFAPSISSACNSLFNCVSANGFFFCGFRPELNVISSVTIPTQMVPVPVEVFCICNPEFVNAEVNCSSFDQCSNSTLNNCNPNATCISTPGSIRCICNPGYIGDGRTCVEIFEFINDASCSSFINCNRNNGTSTCGGSSTLFDLVGIDNNIGQLAGVGSLTDLNFPVPDEIFCLCNPTYADSSFNCSMFDQCSNSTLNDCHPNAICLTIAENIVCICNDGFIGDGKTCIDVNLLTNNPTCNSFVNCSRTNGTLFCGLTPGPDDVGGLIPLNLRIPVPEQIVCLCDPSYSDSQLNCANFILPSLSSACSFILDCSPANGSFFCGIKQGLNQITGLAIPDLTIPVPVEVYCLCNSDSTSSEVNCSDINRCANSTLNVCHPNATCVDTPGNIRCFCDPGFIGNGTVCIDIALLVTNSTCSRFINCTRINSTFSCGLSQEIIDILHFNGIDGLGGFGGISDIVEPNDLSALTDLTIPVPASIFCFCNPNYSDSSFTCEILDLCVNSSACHENATCISTPVNAICVCNPGFFGNGTTCLDINQIIESASCDSFANCTRTNGSYFCGLSQNLVGEFYSFSGFANGFTNLSGTTDFNQFNGLNEFTLGINGLPGLLGLIGSSGFTGIGQINGLSGINGISEIAGLSQLIGLNGLTGLSDLTFLGGLTGIDEIFGIGGLNDVSDLIGISGLNDLSGLTVLGGLSTAGGLTDLMVPVPEEIFCVCNQTFNDPAVNCADYTFLIPDNFCSSLTNCIQLDTGYFCRLSLGSNSGGNFFDIGGLIDGDGLIDFGGLTNITGLLDLNRFPDSMIPVPEETFCLCNPDYFDSEFSCNITDFCFNSTLNDCDRNATCTNFTGGYNCTCNSGFIGNGTECFLDFCSNSTLNDCGSNASCNLVPGGFQCLCDAGFSGNGTFCEDIDECFTDLDDCDDNAACSNTIGSFECVCDNGFSGNGTSCTDIDECALNMDDCDFNANCTNTIGNYTCACNAGYSGNGTICNDVDECMIDSDNCDQNATCMNNVGSFDCTCDPGFSGNGTVCIDIDECTTGDNNCDSNAICANTIGSFTCRCSQGYNGSGFNCFDLNECVSNNDDCDVNANCTNSPGSFICTCNDGYSGNGTECSDIDECILNMDDCDFNANCTNTIGNHTCACNAGFNGNGYNCFDIDECALNMDDCDFNANCTNTIGNYTCACNAGYSGNGTICNDVDECMIDSDNCDQNATCMNNVGSFDCTCDAGFSGNGTVCIDIDECVLGSDNCTSILTICRNIPGSFVCDCIAGYVDNGASCDDLNECVSNDDDCDVNANCTNSPGSFICTCNDGYTGNGTECSDINECVLGSDDCTSNLTICRNIPGSFVCDCIAGYAVNGTSCSDINECLTGAANCDINNAVCVNTDGSFLCTCNAGFTGDGITCSGSERIQTSLISFLFSLFLSIFAVIFLI